MLRLVVSMSSGAAKSYFQDSLSKSDYYLSEQELPAQWHGLAADRLGLSGEVKVEDFYALADNLHPQTGGSVTPGGNRENRRVGYDINFHCPKSVSILHAMGKNDQILPAFQDSVEETMRDMEKDMQTRVRVNGQYDDRNTGNMLWATFTHQTARPTKDAPPDPHLHAHCFTFNMTYDHVEDRFKAGQFVRLKKDGMYYQAMFHKRLADSLQDMGYNIKKTKDAFEVMEVSDAAIDLFSKRTNHIGQVAKEQGITSQSELDALGARTRASKQKGLKMPDLKKIWQEQLSTTPVLIKSKSMMKAPYSLKECQDHAIQHSFERNSVVNDRSILQEALRHSIGSRSVDIQSIHESFEQDKRFVRLNTKDGINCTTHAVLAEEKQMVNFALKGQGQFKPTAMQPVNNWQNKNLSNEQKETVNHILLNRNSITLIHGRAGTGKTTMMREAIHAIEKSNKRVYAFAPTAEASRGVLRQEGLEKADTIAALLTDKELHRELDNQVIWIDEAGLVGSRDMVKVLKLADEKKCRVILSGDDRQHRAVARGDAFRVLHEVAGLPTAGTKTIYRQKREDYRAVVSDLSEGRTAQAYSKLDKMGAIKEHDPESVINQLTDDYVSSITKGKSALVISPTHKEREKVNHSIRAELQALKKVDTKDRCYTKLQSLGYTKAQKKDLQSYKPGMVVQAHLNISKTMGRGSKCKVTKIERGRVWMQKDIGQRFVLPLEHADRFDVYNRKEMNLAKRDLIRITKNGFDIHRSRLDNGQILEISGFTKDGLIKAHSATTAKAVNRKEYILDKAHENFDYAYCQTSYAAQGKTVDHVYIHQPSATFPATNQEQLYVSVSRGRESVAVYTDDKESLQVFAEQSSRRMAAIELENYPHLHQLEPDRAVALKTKPQKENSFNPSPIKPKPHGYDLSL